MKAGNLQLYGNTIHWKLSPCKADPLLAVVWCGRVSAQRRQTNHSSSVAASRNDYCMILANRIQLRYLYLMSTASGFSGPMAVQSLLTTDLAQLPPMQVQRNADWRPRTRQLSLTEVNANHIREPISRVRQLPSWFFAISTTFKKLSRNHVRNSDVLET
jgi:hypothetical protein